MTGNSDELVRMYLDRYAIVWKHLETVEATTECELFGKKLDTPIMLGAMAHYERLRPEGAPLYAQAAKRVNTAMWMGMSTDDEIEAVIASGAPCARIIKPFADKEIMLKAIEHDKRAGACAIAIDVDHSYDKMGNSSIFEGKDLMSLNREAIEEYVKAGLPLYLKGVLSPKDAEICAEAGAAGIVASNHQNMFPWTVPPVRMLSELRKAVGDKLTILADSGLSTGYDVFKALSWGADGVFVVRPMMPIFKEKGVDGVERKLRQMTDELRVCLSRTGAKDIYHIDSDAVVEI